MRLAVVVAVVFTVSEESGFGPSGVPVEEDDEEDEEEDEEDEEEDDPEEAASVVMVRNSLLHQPVLPSDILTCAQPAFELSVTVSFVPCGMVKSAV